MTARVSPRHRVGGRPAVIGIEDAPPEPRHAHPREPTDHARHLPPRRPSRPSASRPNAGACSALKGLSRPAVHALPFTPAVHALPFTPCPSRQSERAGDELGHDLTRSSADRAEPRVAQRTFGPFASASEIADALVSR